MTQTDDPDQRLHPDITNIEGMLTFKIARFAAINAHDGTAIFRKAFDLTLNEWRVLGLVAAHAPLGLQELADLVLMDKGQLSRTVQALVKRGKLVSRVCPVDARKVKLTLTATGTTWHAKALTFARDRNDEVLACLSLAEARHFIALLDRLLDHNTTLVRNNGNL